MLVIHELVGNRTTDADLDRRCSEAASRSKLELVSLSFADAQRGRMLVTTDAGSQIGISIGRDSALRDGDVLYVAPHDDRVIAVKVESPEVMTIRYPSGLGETAMFEAGARLGHVLGNQHWPIAVGDGKVVVTVTVDRLVMETVLRHHGVDGLEHEFEAVDEGLLASATPAEPHEHA